MNRLSIVFGASALVFGSASGYLYNDLRDTRAESVALRARVAELQKASPPPTQDAARGHGAIPINPFGPPPPVEASPGRTPSAASPPPRPVAFATAETGASFGPLASRPLPRAILDQPRMMLENPEYRDAMKRQRKLMLPRMYPDLQAAMQLDDQQTEQLFDLLAEQQVRAMTLQPAFSPPGTQQDPAALRDWFTQRQQVEKESEAAMTTLLGDAGLQQWKNYQNTLPARGQVRELRSTLEGAGVPLQQDQADRLLTAITAEQQKAAKLSQTPAEGQSSSARGVTFRNGPMSGPLSGPINGIAPLAFSEQMVERHREQQQSLRAAVSPILSSQQLRELERMQASQLEMMEINAKMMRAQAEAEGSDVPSVSTSVGFISER